MKCEEEEWDGPEVRKRQSGEGQRKALAENKITKQSKNKK